jgi:type VII secretion integral membrane protein EccD
MSDQQCRVTVIGQRKQVDLAVPARRPIAEYVTELARLCGQEETEALPAAWSLGAAAGPVLPPSACLSDFGVVDGEILYLRDSTAGEYDEAAVLDLEELVAEAVGEDAGWRWDSRTRAAATVVAGAACLVAAVLGVAFGATPGSFAPAAQGLAFGLLLPALALLGRRGGWPLAAVSQRVLALAGVPCLAVAGWFLAPPAPTGGMPFIGAAVGACLGSLVALAVMPGLAVLAIQILALVVLLTVTAVVRLQATGLQAAATCAVVAYGLVLAAPWAVGHLAGLWQLPRRTADAENEAKVAVRLARRTLVAWTCVAAAALAALLVVLGTGGQPFAVALAACLGLAALLRAGRARTLVEVAPVMAAGLAGLAAALIGLPEVLHGVPASAGPVLALGVGSSVLVVGVGRSFVHPGAEVHRPRLFRTVASLCAIASVPLLLGVYGVFQELVSLGRHL